MSGINRALISLSDKSGLEELAGRLVEEGVELISTGGTAARIEGAGLPVTGVSELTGFPEMLEGRVKTLHPRIHAALLADRRKKSHREQLSQEGIEPIDLVVVNLYPFAETISQPEVTLEEAIEQIDIGGPTMLRAAAKNWQNLAVVVDPKDYSALIEQLQEKGELEPEFRLLLAQKAFSHTAAYDSIISRYLWEEGLEQEDRFPPQINLCLEQVSSLRYGENPHQQAALYRQPMAEGPSLLEAEQLHGRDLSYNNLQDGGSALELIREFSQPAAAVIKHNNPCGLAIGDGIGEAFIRAHAGDPLSAFGSIVALNRPLDEDCAREMTTEDKFIEVLIAPEYSQQALQLLRQRWEGIRILMLPELEEERSGREDLYTTLAGGGMLVQTSDQGREEEDSWQLVTGSSPEPERRQDLFLAWMAAKHVRSNAITIARDGALVGVGAGQMSRVDAMIIALRKAGEKSQGAVVASDAFFPKVDAIEQAVNAGIGAVIQPGGSVADERIIERAREAGLTMFFTGTRHFKH